MRHIHTSALAGGLAVLLMATSAMAQVPGATPAASVPIPVTAVGDTLPANTAAALAALPAPATPSTPVAVPPVDAPAPAGTAANAAPVPQAPAPDDQKCRKGNLSTNTCHSFAIRGAINGNKGIFKCYGDPNAQGYHTINWNVIDNIPGFILQFTEPQTPNAPACTCEIRNNDVDGNGNIIGDIYRNPACVACMKKLCQGQYVDSNNSTFLKKGQLGHMPGNATCVRQVTQGNANNIKAPDEAEQNNEQNDQFGSGKRGPCFRCCMSNMGVIQTWIKDIKDLNRKTEEENLAKEWYANCKSLCRGFFPLPPLAPTPTPTPTPTAPAASTAPVATGGAAATSGSNTPAVTPIPTPR